MDIITKVNIAKKVIEECEEHADNSEDAFKANDELSMNYDIPSLTYMGQVISMSSLCYAASFRELERLKDVSPVCTMNLSSTHIRSILYSFYLYKRQIPTLSDISNFSTEVQQESVTHPYGFIWRQLPGMKLGIITEDPKRVEQRMLYIKKMEYYRKTERHIIYVHRYTGPQGSLSSNDENHNILHMAISSKIGLVHTNFFSEDTEISMKTFLVGLLSKVESECDKARCVIVMEEVDKHSKVPSTGSLKSEMSDWLKENGIPHDPNAHRGELHSLIVKNKDIITVRTTQDDIISGLGNDVLTRPKDMDEIDYFRDFWKSYSYKNTHKNVADTFRFAKSLTRNQLQSFEKNLIDTEKRINKQDILMEEIIDSLILMAKDKKLPESTPGLIPFHGISMIYKEIIID